MSDLRWQRGDYNTKKALKTNERLSSDDLHVDVDVDTVDTGRKVVDNG